MIGELRYMMSDKQYKVAVAGIVSQIRMAQRLHCRHMEEKHKMALRKLQKRYLKPDSQEMIGHLAFRNHYHI